MYLILVILLSVIPCSDVLEAKGFVENTIITIAHDKDNCNTENCSAVCLCNCCGQSVVEIEMINFTIEIPANTVLELNVINNFKLENRNQNIWQPPKMITNC